MEDNIKKALTFLLAVIGLVIFYSIFMKKIDLMAYEAEVKMQKLSSDVSWEGLQYQKTIEDVLDERNASQEEYEEDFIESESESEDYDNCEECI